MVVAKLNDSHLREPLAGGRSDEQGRQIVTGRDTDPVVIKEGEIMRGAIPYYKTQLWIAPQEVRTGLTKPDRPDTFQILLCNMVHQVNNLLMRIQGYASLMLMDVKEGQAGFERLKHIENSVGYGAVLTSELLAFAGRRVYADPVNIPPLLLATAGTTGATPSDNEVRSRLFIVGQKEDDLCPGLLSTCLEITKKIGLLFSGIERVSLHGRNNWIEKEYIGRIRAATGEGSRLAREVAAVCQPVHRTGQPSVSRRRAVAPRANVISLHSR